MKSLSSFYLPLGAAALVALWLGSELQQIHSLEATETGLRQQLATAAEHRPRGDSGSSAPDRPGAMPFKGDYPDWVRLAKNSMRYFQSYQEWLLDRNAGELVAAYRDLQTAGLDTEAFNRLAAQLAYMMTLKDPRLALDTFRDRITGRYDDWTRFLSEAVQKVAVKDPDYVAAWIDGLAAEGRLKTVRLNDTFGPRPQFESALIRSALVSDPALAAQRLNAVPASDRKTYLTQYCLTSLPAELIPALVSLTQQTLEAQDQRTVLGYAIQAASQANPDDIKGIAAWVDAAPAETRKALLSDSTNTLMAQTQKLPADAIVTKVNEIGAWVRSEQPEEAASIIAAAIGQMAFQMPLDQAADIVGRVDGDGDYRDQLLAGLLESYAGRQNPEAARTLSEKITSPELRQSVIRSLSPDQQ